MRKANLVQTAIWHDADFSALGVDSKLLYLLLITQPDVTHVGVLMLATKKWARQLGLSVARFQKALRELVDTRFAVHDEATDELLIRTWVKHNLAGSKLETAGKTHFALVESPLIRWVLQSEHPDLFGDPPPDTPSHPLSDTPSDTPSSKRGEGSRVLGQVVSGGSESERARVWAAYQEHHPRSALTSDRRSLIDRRLADYPADRLIAAIHGNHLDPHCNGDNPRGQEYHDLELILRDAGHIERYAAVAADGPPQPRSQSPAGKTLALARQLAEEGR